MRSLIVLIVLFWWVGMSSATNLSSNDIEWNVAVSGTLYRGDTLTNEEYKIKATQFSSPVPGIKNMQGNIVPDDVIYPMVYLEIYKSGVLFKEIVMSMTSEPYIDPDYEIKISVTEFLKRSAREWVYEYYNPWAIVSIQTRGRPKLEVEIITEKAAYTSYNDDVISAKIKITNTGEAFIKNVDVNVDIGGLKLRGGDIRELHEYYYRMDKKTVQSFMVILLVPELIEEKSYYINATAKGYDIEDVEYNTTTSLSVKIYPQKDYLIVSKALKDRIYLDDKNIVKIVVSNGGIYDIYDIYVTDEINENFELESNTSLQWYIPTLKPGQAWDTTYSIRPIKASLSGFQIPVTIAKFTVNNKQYRASSERTVMIVNGPIIVLNKTVDKNIVSPGKDVKVTVTINNIGNVPTKVEVKDSMSEDIKFVSGQTSLPSTFLEVNTPHEFSYVIRKDTEGYVQLPSAVARYVGVAYRGTRWLETNSDRPTITFVDMASSESELSKELPVTNVPGFGIIISVIAVILIYIYRQKSN